MLFQQVTLHEWKLKLLKRRRRQSLLLLWISTNVWGGGGGHYRYDILSLCNREGYTKVLEIIICFNFVDLATMNSYILYRILTADKKMERKQFVIKVFNKLRVNNKLAKGTQRLAELPPVPQPGLPHQQPAAHRPPLPSRQIRKELSCWFYTWEQEKIQGLVSSLWSKVPQTLPGALRMDLVLQENCEQHKTNSIRCKPCLCIMCVLFTNTYMHNR